jgi:hypothetical protein
VKGEEAGAGKKLIGEKSRERETKRGCP